MFFIYCCKSKSWFIKLNGISKWSGWKLPYFCIVWPKMFFRIYYNRIFIYSCTVPRQVRHPYVKHWRQRSRWRQDRERTCCSGILLVARVQSRLKRLWFLQTKPPVLGAALRQRNFRRSQKPFGTMRVPKPKVWFEPIPPMKYMPPISTMPFLTWPMKTLCVPVWKNTWIFSKPTCARSRSLTVAERWSATHPMGKDYCRLPRQSSFIATWDVPLRGLRRGRFISSGADPQRKIGGGR